MYGIFGAPAGVQQMGARVAQNVPQEKKRGLFGGDANINPKLAMLSQIFSGMAGQESPVFQVAMAQRLQRQRAEQEAQQAEAERQARRQEFMFEHDYKRNNPEPRTNDTIEDFNWYKGLSPEDRATYDQMRPVVIDGPDGRYVVPRSALQGQGGAPVAPVGKLTPIGGAQAPASPPFAVRQGFAPSGIPGERITSTLRTPARNRAVGGVPNSYHLTGQARDSVPPPGMSMDEYYRRLKAANPDMDVINEGDHVHIEPRGR